MVPENVKAAFDHRAGSNLPRGELWICTKVFAECQMEDCVETHMELCQKTGMDLISLPVGQFQEPNYEYRQFSPLDIQKAVQGSFFIAAVLSGPFQRMVERIGLRYVLANFARDIEEAAKEIEKEAGEVGRLIDACISYGADAVVIAEDLAFDSGLFIGADMFHQAVYPHYTTFVDDIHCGHGYAIFHSCGNITNILPDIVSSGFDGLSCENYCIDTIFTTNNISNKVNLVAGIDPRFLEDGSFTWKGKKHFTQLIEKSSMDGGLLLSSSSGLHNSHMLLNLQKLYDLADKIWHRNITAET